jgi:mitochondrial fission protein ELM1
MSENRPEGHPDAPVWVLADPRPGTAAQALGIAERLPVPHRMVRLAWSKLARLPLPWPGLWGLTAEAREAILPPWPRLVLSAGRRSAPVALWLARHGARTVHCMRPGPGFAAARFDLLVLPRHDRPAEAPDILPILGATHRISPARLAEARAEWAGELAGLPSPRVALLVGGRVRAEGMDPAVAAGIGARVAGFAGSVMATTSRRTGTEAGQALAAALSPVPHRLFRWGEAGRNPYLGFLAWAEAVVVTGDSVSMLSEALATEVPVFIADPGGLGPRHRALAESLVAAGQARLLAAAPVPFARQTLDESGRVAQEIMARRLLTP